MHPSIALTTLLVALASALPAPSPSLIPRQSSKFGVAMTVPGNYTLNLVAANNGTAGPNGSSELLLQAVLGEVTGTPAYLNGTGNFSDPAALIFDLSDSDGSTIPPGLYGASAADIGEDYGLAVNVFLNDGFKDFGFYSSNGTLYHKLDAASNSFFACLGSVNGVESWVLNFGAFTSEGLPPTGCELTVVKQVF